MRPLPNSVKLMDGVDNYHIDATSIIDRIKKREILEFYIMGYDDTNIYISNVHTIIMEYNGRNSSIPTYLRELAFMFNCVINFDK